MRRRWHLVLLFVLIGATLNLVVAWSCALIEGTRLTSSSAQFRLPDDEEKRLWLRYRSADMKQAAGVVRTDSGVGLEILHLFGDMLGKLSVNERGDGLSMAPVSLDAPDQSALLDFEVGRFVRAGWPLRSFEGQTWGTFGPKRTDNWSTHWCWMSPDWSGTSETAPLPYFPLWIGFATNTVLYAGVAYLPVLLLLHLRRFMRVRRGRCAACGYPIGVSDRCTECGAFVLTKRQSSVGASISSPRNHNIPNMLR